MHQHSNFNSIKVRLELTKEQASEFSCTFQFHKGAIRTLSQPCIIIFGGDFNSIKVRLEPHGFLQINTAFKFQFHKGAIRTPTNVQP